MPVLLPLMAALALAAPPAAAAQPGVETAIPYAGSDGILEWTAAGRDTLLIRAMTGGWFKVRTMGPCPRLQTALSLGFIVSPGDQLDRYSAILAEGMRCQIDSVTTAEAPPSSIRRHKG